MSSQPESALKPIFTQGSDNSVIGSLNLKKMHLKNIELHETQHLRSNLITTSFVLTADPIETGFDITFGIATPETKFSKKF